MEYRTTRSHAALKACRIRRDVIVLLAVLAWLVGLGTFGRAVSGGGLR